MGVIAFAPFNKAEPKAFLLKFILMLVKSAERSKLHVQISTQNS